MGKFITTVADSQVHAGTLPAFTDSAASTYTLEAGAFLISTAGNNIILTGAGAWTATINGQASGPVTGLYLLGSGASAKVTVGEDGSLRAQDFGGFYSERDTALTNKGFICSTGNSGAQLLGTGTNSITNSGVIAGSSTFAVSFYNASNDTVTNSGTIYGGVHFTQGTNKLINTGQIIFGEYGSTAANVLFDSGTDSLDNKGLVNGYIDLGSGSNTLKNAGRITGFDGNGNSIIGGVDADKVDILKGGVVNSGINLGDGVNTFSNAGTIGQNFIGHSVDGGSGVDTVKNSGTLDGDVYLFGGNDVFTNTGFLGGEIDLGDGDDKFTGGNFSESVKDGIGSDNIALGGGNDTFVAFGGEGDGADTVDGGTGRDTYSALDSANGLIINLDKVDHTITNYFVFNTVNLAKSSASDAVTGHADSIKGFEVVMGSFHNDYIWGSSAADTIWGAGGTDEIRGGAGNDAIDGGSGVDVIVGGLGADVLTGGGSTDIFVLETLKDSGVTKATRDVITDFTDGEDTISLQNLDADTRDADNDVFSAIIMGTGSFTVGTAGQLRIYETSSGWMIEGEVNGDAKADFSIAVDDMDHSIGWALIVSDDFVA